MVWSCIKLHVTHEIVNYVSRLIIRATSCTLRHRELRIKVNYSCNKLHATHEMRELHIEVNYSCNKLHVTGEDSIRIAYGFYSQTLGGYNKSAVSF